MSKVHIRRTWNPYLIGSIMLHPDIWATVAEDGQDPGDFNPDPEHDAWLVVSVDHIEIGIFHLPRFNGVTLEIHAQVLPEYRKEYSKASGRAALNWIYDNVTWCKKVIAWVPTTYPNVKNYARSMGFKTEGKSRESYLKNGELVDQWLLGITRTEIGELRHG